MIYPGSNPLPDQSKGQRRAQWRLEIVSDSEG
jgi:hypothetical protein